LSDFEWVDSEARFDEILADNTQVVVDFTAPAWCVPCQRFAPHFEKASDMHPAKFVAVDVDKAPWAMARYGVQSVPTVKMFKDEEFVEDVTARTAIKLLSDVPDLT
jgi:thioredoxin 1